MAFRPKYMKNSNLRRIPQVRWVVPGTLNRYKSIRDKSLTSTTGKRVKLLLCSYREKPNRNRLGFK